MRVMSREELRKYLLKLDGKAFSRYKSLRNVLIKYGKISLILTKVQGDPHAPPSYVEVKVSLRHLEVPTKYFSGLGAIALTDYLTRKLYRVLKRSRRPCGSGNSCYLGVPKPSPRILRRSCCEVINEDLIIRFFIGLPARGRRILGREAINLLLNKVPKAIEEVVDVGSELGSISKHYELLKDQRYLREWLYMNGYVFFVPDGAVLPRESSISEAPKEGAIKFKSPPTLRVEVRLPSGKVVKGMAVKEGVIVITGGGYHGKTTLLEAIQDGIYDHIEGDGREYVVSRKYTVLIKAEDGRLVSNVDISSLIRNLPEGTDTSKFSTLDASGSTSMAASISEAIEAGAEFMLLDEDTSATNLLFKDEVMRKLIPNDPIRTLSELVRDLVRKSGTSVAVVTSASSSFLPVADTVIRMSNYLPEDLSDEVAGRGRGVSSRGYRLPKKRLFKGIKGLRKVKVQGMKLIIEYLGNGKFELDLKYYPRVVEAGQVRMIAHVIKYLSKPSRPMSIKELINYVNSKFSNEGFKAFSNPVPPDLTEVDGFDVVWVLNRVYKVEFAI